MYAGPSVRCGIEYNLKGDDWSLYHEAGYFLFNRGFLLKTEAKKYLDAGGINEGTYLSMEFYYKYQQYEATDSISDFVNNKFKPYQKNYQVLKHVECFTVKFGSMNVYKRGLVADWFVGAGLRFKQARSGLTSRENENIMDSSDYGPNVFSNEAGFKVYPNIDMGVKIGFRVK
jgi:hypothetical protein